MWGYTTRPAPTVTGGGGKASGIEIFDQNSRKKMVQQIEEGTMNGNERVVNPATPLDPVRVTVDEAAVLQAVPTAFTWDAEYIDAKGKARKVPNTKKYLVIGNACPPLWTQAILESLWDES